MLYNKVPNKVVTYYVSGKAGSYSNRFDFNVECLKIVQKLQFKEIFINK